MSTLRHLLETDVLAVECLGEKDLAAVEAEGAAVADASNLDVARIDRRLDTVGVGTHGRREQ
jgi:hypothetical protein